jgi:uncharacterized protein DUF3892
LLPFFTLPQDVPSPDVIKAGGAFAPEGGHIFFLRLPLSPIPIAAYPASIEALGDGGSTSILGELEGRPLVYLGQVNGTAVLYDSIEQEALFLPLSTIALRVNECTAENCTIPAAREITCVDKTRSHQEIDTIGVMEEGERYLLSVDEAIGFVKSGEVFFYYRDARGSAVNVVVASTSARPPFLKSIRDKQRPVDLLSLEDCIAPGE